MADGGEIRRRREAPQQINYEETLTQLLNFVENNQNNAPAPQARPDVTEWREQRRKTIQKLHELRENLDSICVGANYGKATGNSAEILGISTTIVGACMAVSGLPSCSTVINTGNIVQRTGSVIESTSNLIETIFSEKYLAEIQEVLKRDQKLSLPLAEWLDFSRQLDANVQAIFGVSLTSDKFSTVIKVFHGFYKICTAAGIDFKTSIALMNEGVYSIYIDTDVKTDLLEKFFEHISFPQLGSILSALDSKEFKGLTRFYRDGARLIPFLTGRSMVVSSSQIGVTSSMKAVGTFCFLQGINLSLSVLSLINAVSIIRDGKSKYSDAIRQLTDALDYELRQMNNF